MGILSAFAFVIISQYALGDGHKLDANLSVQGKTNPTIDPLQSFQARYRLRENFGLQPFDRRFYKDGLRFADEFKDEPGLRSGLFDYLGTSGWDIRDQQKKSAQVSAETHARLLREYEAEIRRREAVRQPAPSSGRVNYSAASQRVDYRAPSNRVNLNAVSNRGITRDLRVYQLSTILRPKQKEEAKKVLSQAEKLPQVRTRPNLTPEQSLAERRAALKLLEAARANNKTWMKKAAPESNAKPEVKTEGKTDEKK